jgi:hypothetical protein
MELLQLDWYYQPPIDIEHKQYKLFSYLKTIDEAFYDHHFSPYLLHTEKLVEEMRISLLTINNFSKSLTKKSLVFSWEGLYLKDDAPSLKDLDIVVDILDFSIPLLDQRIDLGKKLHRRFPTVLY